MGVIITSDLSSFKHKLDAIHKRPWPSFMWQVYMH